MPPKGHFKYSIIDMRRLAAAKSGECLSTKYQSASIKLEWRCRLGHVWKAIPYTVLRGSWCRKCAHEKASGASQRLSIDWFQQYAEKKGGKCLTTRYSNAWSKLTFVCSKNHRWATPARNARRGSWCPQCGGSAPLKIEFYKKIASDRGGRCLTKLYHNQRQVLKFVCRNGHHFNKSAGAIRATSQWCPECAQNTGERICRIAFETLFNAKFDSAWPLWLRNSRNQPMELDGYNKKLGIAFEHQGEQHYSTITHWIDTKSKLLLRKRDDKRKYYLARKNNVKLFRIPQVPNRVSTDKLIQYIVRRAIAKGITVRKDWQSIKIDFNRVYHGHASERIKDCVSLASKKGGKFLSTEWKGEDHKYLWECSNNHRWETTARIIRSGSWCKYCSGKAKLTLRHFQNLAAARGGVCLSSLYVSGKHHLTFRCSMGHTFLVTGNNVKNHGRWCPECAGKKRLTIGEMRVIAQSKQGKCLSKRYLNNKSKLKWECASGHQWLAAPKKIKQGQWCPTCGKNRIWATRRMRSVQSSQ